MGNKEMSIAYSIQGAAAAAAVTELVIIQAVKANLLIARRVPTGAPVDTAIILRTDLQAWAETLPNFRETI